MKINKSVNLFWRAIWGLQVGISLGSEAQVMGYKRSQKRVQMLQEGDSDKILENFTRGGSDKSKIF